MTRVIHTGDTHVGYRQYHSPERRADFLAAFRRVVDDAVADDVDAVVHAGDLFHDRRPDLQALLGTIDVLSTLREADVPFLAVVGNHEGTRDAQWLDLFETLGLATRLDRSGTVVGDVAVYGLDYVPRAQRERLEYDFEPRDASHAALVGHGLFSPLAAYGDWDVEAVLEASPVDFDAVLLGDDHQPDRTEVGDTWVTYCGSTERASAEERDERGYNIVTFDGADGESGAGGVSIARRGIETRDFAFVDLELAEGEGTERVCSRLREETLEDAVAVVTIEGEGESVVPAEVERVGREAGALLTRVNDRRERADREPDREVSFADPDRAVRERVREMGLSDAARGIDEVVRSADVADTNVRDHVEDRVRERLGDDDLDAFRAAEDTGVDAGDADEGAGVADSSEEDGAAEADEVGSDDADPAEADPADADQADEAQWTDDVDGEAADADEETDDVDGETADAEDASDGHGERATAGPADSEESAAGDGQASMGDYL